MQKITPCLWFDNNCKEAIDFYTSAFKNSKVHSIQLYPENVETPSGPASEMKDKVITAIFELEGFTFMGLDGGPIFQFNPSISFFVNFDPSKDDAAKENLKNLWDKLVEGGEALMDLQEYPFSKYYGWVKDKYGVTWQLILTDPTGEPRPTIVPSLLFTQDMCGKAEEAIDFYVSVFKNSKKGIVSPYQPGQAKNDKAKTAYGDFMIEGHWIAAMDSGVDQDYKFNEAISLQVECEDQNEVDELWSKLSSVPASEQCGWCKDKFGVSWQIIPKEMGKYLGDPDKEKSGRAMKAMLEMKKIDLQGIKDAFEGK